MPDRGVGFSALERLEALVSNPALFELADAVPEPDPSVGGRPRLYPVFMWLLFDALLSVYGSGRKVEAELAHPTVWSRLRRHVRDAQPDRSDLWLPRRPMRRTLYADSVNQAGLALMHSALVRGASDNVTCALVKVRQEQTEFEAVTREDATIPVFLRGRSYE